MGKIIGIDLGTTNSVVAIMEGKSPRSSSTKGGRLTPSVVGFDDKARSWLDRLLVASPLPTRKIRSPIKRFMGRKARSR